MSLNKTRPSFESQGAMKLIGANLLEVQEGRIVIEVPFRDDLSQQNGYFHAGILTTAADSAGGYAAYTMMPPGSGVLATEFKMNFLRPAKGDRAVATGKVVKSGRTLTVCDLWVHVFDGEERTLVARGLQTCIRVDE